MPPFDWDIPTTSFTVAAGDTITTPITTTAPPTFATDYPAAINTGISLFKNTPGPTPITDPDDTQRFLIKTALGYTEGGGNIIGGVLQIVTSIDLPAGTYTAYADAYSRHNYLFIDPVDGVDKTKGYVYVADNLFLQHTITLTITVTAPAPPVIPPRDPRNSAGIVAVSSIGLPTGGGSPRLFGLVTATKSSDTTFNFTSPTFIRSDDFGESFRPGVEIGAKDHLGNPISDNYSAERVYLSGINAFPSGTLFAYGFTGPNAWFAPRISFDGGNTWRDTTTKSGDTSGSTILLNGSMSWYTRGGDPGQNGSGNQSGGAYQLLALGQSPTPPLTPLLSSKDDGDTWQIHSPLTQACGPQVAYGALYATQPQSLRGVSWNNAGWSEDDFIDINKYHHVFPLGYTDIPRIADEDVVIGPTPPGYGYYSKYRQYAIGISGRFFTVAGLYPWSIDPDSLIRLCWCSSTKDGANLTPIIQLSTSDSRSLIWAWKNFIVLLIADAYDGSTMQVYKSDNLGKWYRKTCHSTNGGRSWVSD